MHDEEALFADPRPTPAAPIAPPVETLPDWQVDNLRKALDALNLETMAERQAVVEELVGRPVDSLRDLTFAESRTISEALVARRTDTRGSDAGSAWDNREEDTWIDRL